MAEPAALAEPLCGPLLRRALQLREASLVIFRQRVLVEFKTELLSEGLSAYEEDGYVSWQIGAFEGHHCHLQVEKVTGVVFDAEPVSCQGGKINYTVWFQVDFDAGNPYRDGGYFSITLNGPYDDRGRPRREVIDPVFELYRVFEHEPWVSATEGFEQARSSGRYS